MHNLVLEAVASTPGFRFLADHLPPPAGVFRLSGMVGSAAAATVAALAPRAPGRIRVAVLPSPRSAAAFQADLESLMGEGESVLFPQREALPYEASDPHMEIAGLRVEAVEAVFSGRVSTLVTTARALQERIPVPARLDELRLTLRVGDEPGFKTLLQSLEDRGFDRVPLVEEVGQYAVRGGLVDLFSFGAAEPTRVEFWGEAITSMRAFDVLDQRSTGTVEQVHILPVGFHSADRERARAARSLLELLPDGTLLVDVGGRSWDEEMHEAWRHTVRVHAELAGTGATHLVPPQELLLPPDRATEARAVFARLELVPAGGGDASLGAEPPLPIERDIERLAGILRQGAARAERSLLLCDNDGQAQRLEELLGGEGRLPAGVQVAIGSLDGGFELPTAAVPLRIFTDHEIFRRARRLRRSRRFRGSVALESLAQLRAGDYVVHMEHGVGRFQGMERVHVAGQDIEALAIEYAGGEILRVPVYRLDLVERWVGEDERARPPQVHRIGGRRWKAQRGKAEKAIERLTVELIDLYARRETAKGFAFSADTRWQMEMESSFLYEDTPDQRAAAEDVKRDMESTRPMDRLICGDVGYGKTEVAIRAAFKAVQDGKQVAVLAPTTILVEQHRHTFEERLADYPVRIGALSRFRGSRDTRALLAELEAGSLDILIGTHRLLSHDVRFRDLGLIVVDEEQRFGVRHKERLKHLREEVDVLTLSATPIPRTLYLSLSRVRDLTVMRTPPRDRMPILTHVLPWSDGLVAEALQRELDRGGQAFFLHNRVETIRAAAERVSRLIPDARVKVAHGQMPTSSLDREMRSFVDGETDVLVCSAIIENGLDVANANTLIVHRADRFGLAQLYQIRGRVGRADRRAYCYLIVPERPTEDARRRLRVLEHYTELGSGYSVALRDLELRGAGNLLGADQSGFAHTVGIEAYLRLLERTVERLQRGIEDPSQMEPDVSLGGSAFLPEAYVSDSGQKLHLYRRLSKIRQRSEVEELRAELADRFGPIPEEVQRLLDGSVLRLLGKKLGLQRILVHGSEARLSFLPGVVPRLQVLQAPLREGQVEVEVRRVSPLSLALKRIGPERVTTTLMDALSVLLENREASSADRSHALHGGPPPARRT